MKPVDKPSGKIKIKPDSFCRRQAGRLGHLFRKNLLTAPCLPPGPESMADVFNSKVPDVILRKQGSRGSGLMGIGMAYHRIAGGQGEIPPCGQLHSIKILVGQEA